MEKKDKGTYNYWFITINNPPLDSWRQVLHNLGASWAKGQLEKGESGTPHIQAVAYWSTKRRGSAFKGVSGWFKGVTKSDA